MLRPHAKVRTPPNCRTPIATPTKSLAPPKPSNISQEEWDRLYLQWCDIPDPVALQRAKWRIRKQRYIARYPAKVKEYQKKYREKKRIERENIYRVGTPPLVEKS